MAVTVVSMRFQDNPKIYGFERFIAINLPELAGYISEIYRQWSPVLRPLKINMGGAEGRRLRRVLDTRRKPVCCSLPRVDQGRASG
jgi:hypothetical protein